MSLDALWRPFEIAPGGRTTVRVGCIHLWFERRPHEWRIAWWRGADPFESETSIVESSTLPPAEAEMLRAVTSEITGRVSVTPRVPDRPVVIRPTESIVVGPRGSERIFPTVPIWLDLRIGKDLVRSVPTWEPAPTWIGANTREGEFGYAIHDPAAEKPANVPPSRATVPITVVNRTAEAQELERLVVDVQEMAIYRDAEGCLWTDASTATSFGDGTGVPSRVDGAPTEARGAVRLSAPRERGEGNLGRMVGRVLRGGDA